jgi:hypothetical protein
MHHGTGPMKSSLILMLEPHDLRLPGDVSCFAKQSQEHGVEVIYTHEAFCGGIKFKGSNWCFRKIIPP